MGLDVYVGSLTRYYVEGSADVVDRIARRQGLPAGDGQDAEEVIRTAVVRWRDRLSSWLGDRLAAPLDWDESGPAPCFTDKPGWDGYGGALLLAAHDEHPELPAPARVSADWPDDPAYQAASAPGAGSRYHQLLTPELWLPCRFDFTVRTQDLTGEEVELGSSEALLGQLELLSARYRLDSRPPGAGRRRALALGRGRQRPGRAAAPGRAVGDQPGPDEARLLGRSRRSRPQPQNRLWAPNRAAGSQRTRGPRYILIVR